ncbi:15285_t:CDS:1, partial [Cetraspora pellucida]
EPENVKEKYREIAAMAKIRHRERWPNSKRTYKKKQKPISFSKPDNSLPQSDMENTFYFPKNNFSTLQCDNNIIYNSSIINNFDCDYCDYLTITNNIPDYDYNQNINNSNIIISDLKTYHNIMINWHN